MFSVYLWEDFGERYNTALDRASHPGYKFGQKYNNNSNSLPMVYYNPVGIAPDLASDGWSCSISGSYPGFIMTLFSSDTNI